MTFTQYQDRVFFVIGLAGVIATGVIAGIGGDNYWALAGLGGRTSRGTLALFLAGVMVAGCDVIAGGVMFAGGVLAVQRLRGRV